MHLLTFQARRFRWQAHETGDPDAGPPPSGGEAHDAVVAFVHAEAPDEEDAERRRVLRHALKHLKWLAGKRGLRRVVLHSFTHLGGETGDGTAARALLEEIAERLRATGYEVFLTPFGWSCAWELEVFGEAIAKVWKET